MASCPLRGQSRKTKIHISIYSIEAVDAEIVQNRLVLIVGIDSVKHIDIDSLVNENWNSPELQDVVATMETDILTFDDGANKFRKQEILVRNPTRPFRFA